MAGLTGDNINMVNVAISMFTLAVGVIGSVAFRGFMSIIPILFGVVCGYVFAAIMGIVNFQPVIDAPGSRYRISTLRFSISTLL